MNTDLREAGAVPLTGPEPMYVGPRAGWAYRLLWRVAGVVLRLLFRLRLDAPDGVLAGGPYIVVANHQNWMDAPAILLQLPREPRINFLCDDAFVLGSRLESFVARRIEGLILVDPRGHNGTRTARQVALCLSRGGWVGIFPEGRYGERESELLPLRPGFARFALSLGVPVVPMAISGGRDLWLRKEIRVTVGRPIEPGGHTVDSLVEETRGALLRMLPAYHAPGGRHLLQGWLSRAFS